MAEAEGRPGVVPLRPEQYQDLVKRALQEDLGGTGDITTMATVPPTARARGVWIAKAVSYTHLTLPTKA